MNKRGFISTSIIYTFFTFILLSLSLYLVNVRETNILQNTEIKKIKEDLNYLGTHTGLAKLIIEQNGGKNEILLKTKPDFTQIAHTNEGLHIMKDDYGTSYYFRGAVNNNWVYFAGSYWRVIRINGDGSVRMIYSGNQIPTSAEATVMTGTKTELPGSTRFNASGSSAEYLGYMYTLGEQRGHAVSSLPKLTLESWYLSNLKDYDAYIHDAVFCADRSTYVGNVGGTSYSGPGYGTANSAFASASRLYSANNWTHYGTGPILTCPDKEDRYTVSDDVMGNGKLSQKVGMLTADEAIVAGAIAGTSSTNAPEAKQHYLYTGRNYWTLSPGTFTNSIYGTFYMTTLGYPNFNYVTNEYGLRPVINLKPTVDGTGTGTYNDPYIIRFSRKIDTAILNDNGGKTHIEGKIHAFNIPSTTNEGMYSMDDDHGKSYYFRGAVDNNWLKFANYYWRIVRINGNGSIKLIYTGAYAPIESEKAVMTGLRTYIETSPFNVPRDSGEYIGYMYTLGEHRGHSTSSTVKTRLDLWYENNLSDYEEYLNDFVVCNDRGFTVENWTPVGKPPALRYADPYYRLRVTHTPQLKCPHKEDRYTVSDTTIGNGQLTYPIGLLTADEAVLAGGHNSENYSYYLHNNSYYWLVSPNNLHINEAFVFHLYTYGYVGASSGDDNYAVRPVISLSPDLLVYGTGQWNDPYIVIE